MTKAAVLPVSIDEAEGIAAIIRDADSDELDAIGVEVVEGLKMCFGGSMKASKIVVAGKIVAVFGDSFHDSETGVPWLISTTHVGGHARAFLKVCKPEVQEMLTRHHRLINYVDARNTQAIRWLKWLGFEFGEAVPYGKKGLLFFQFQLTKQI